MRGRRGGGEDNDAEGGGGGGDRHFGSNTIVTLFKTKRGVPGTQYARLTVVQCQSMRLTCFSLRIIVHGSRCSF